MFMKNYKKSVATLMTTITLFAGLHGDVFAKEVEEGQCRGVWDNEGFEVVKCKIDGKEYIIANKLKVIGGIAVVQVK